jgi:hypothetical protein
MRDPIEDHEFHAGKAWSIFFSSRILRNTFVYDARVRPPLRAAEGASERADHFFRPRHHVCFLATFFWESLKGRKKMSSYDSHHHKKLVLFFNQNMRRVSLDRSFREDIIRWMVETTIDDSPHHYCSEFQRLVPPNQRAHDNRVEPLACSSCVLCWILDEILVCPENVTEEVRAETELHIRCLKENLIPGAMRTSGGFLDQICSSQQNPFEEPQQMLCAAFLAELGKFHHETLVALQKRCVECGVRGVLHRCACRSPDFLYCSKNCQRRNWIPAHRALCKRAVPPPT